MHAPSRLCPPSVVLLIFLALLAPCIATAAESDIDVAHELVQQGQYKQAYDLLAPIQATQANNVAFKLLLAEAALETGNAEQARMLFEQVLVAEPDSLHTLAWGAPTWHWEKMHAH